MRISFRFSIDEKVWIIEKDIVFQAVIKKAIFTGDEILYEVDRLGEITIHKQKNIKTEYYKGFSTKCE